MTRARWASDPAEPYALTARGDRRVPWAGLGADLTLEGGAATAAEAARRGGLGFGVGLWESGFRAPRRRGSGVAPGWHDVPHRRAAVREDTGQFFEFVSSDYSPVQYSEAFGFMDSLAPHYVAAGTLGGGRQGFMIVELPGRARLSVSINGRADDHRVYGVLRTSHDRSRGLEVCVLVLRSACTNALTLASLTRGAQWRWSVRHVGDPVAKLEQARATLSRTDAYTAEFRSMVLRLAAVELAGDEGARVLERVLPDLPRRPRQVATIMGAWLDDGTNFAYSGWGLVNAVGEYFEWGRPDGLRTPESRFTSGLNGPTHRYTNRVAQLLLRR